MGETPTETTANTQVSHEIDGRVLTGVGGEPEALDTLTERYAPESEPAAEGTPVAPADGKAPIEAPAQSEKPTRGRQRFADLTRERDEARQAAARDKAEREAIARERDELRARLAQPAVAAPPASPEPAAPVYTRPEPSVDEVGTKYETYEAFTRDQARWVLEQERLGFQQEIRQSIEADRAQRDFMATVERTRDAGRKAYADFDAQLTGGPGALVPLGPTPAEAMQRAAWVIQHPQSEHIQYAILKDGALARRLQQMDAVSFGHEIARLAPSGSGAALASPARTGAVTPPAPYQPVGSGSSTTVTPSAELVKKGGFDFDKSGYRERRAAERGVTRRR